MLTHFLCASESIKLRASGSYCYHSENKDQNHIFLRRRKFDKEFLTHFLFLLFMTP